MPEDNELLEKLLVITCSVLIQYFEHNELIEIHAFFWCLQVYITEKSFYGFTSKSTPRIKLVMLVTINEWIIRRKLIARC